MKLISILIISPVMGAWIGSWLVYLKKDSLRQDFNRVRQEVSRFSLWVVPMVLILQQRFPGLRKPSESTCRELRKQYSSHRTSDVYRFYMVRQISRVFVILMILLVLFPFSISVEQGHREIKGELLRPDFQEGARTELLIAETEDEKLQLSVSIEPVGPNQTETDAILTKAKEKLRNEFSKLGEIHRSLQLPVQDGDVRISYMSSNGLISSSGYLRISSSMKEYRLERFQALLEYQGKQLKVDLELLINTISEESLYSQIMQAIEENQTDEKIVLPQSVMVNGERKEIRYYEPEKQPLWPFWILLWLVLPVLVFQAGKEQLQKENQKRKVMIHQHFPYAAEKLAIYLGAGMGLEEAWNRVSMDGNETDPLVSEMRLTSQQLKSGIGMQEALLQFGNRTESSDLKKMAGILARNIRRGDDYLLENLKNLNHEAWQQHRREVKMAMEKAQTKMVFPMLLMMSVVLILILAPALITML